MMDHGQGAVEHSLFVGDLGEEIDDHYLLQFFQSYYSSVRSVKIVLDPATGRSKGFAFVRFLSEPERDRALNEMSGVFIGSRAIRCRLATPAAKGQPGDRDVDPGRGGRDDRPGGRALPPPITGPDDPNNTTLFVGGLTSAVSEEQLRHAFMRYGEVVYCKVPPNKGCGFVQFMERRCAEYALQEMNGAFIGSCAIRVSWGKSTKGPTGGDRDRYGSSYTSATSFPTYAPGFSGPASAGAYPGYDPYGAGGMYGAAGDPYGGAYGAYDAYGYHSAYGYGAGHYGAANGMHGAGMPSSSASQGTPTIYDPLVSVGVDRLNSAYMHRQLPQLTGTFLRVRG